MRLLRNEQAWRGVKILVAEDSRAVRSLLQRHLTEWGHDVVAVEDGRAALQALRNEEISVAILDWMMPGADGLEVCRGTRALNRFVYAILLTGKGAPDDMVRALEAGASDYLLKRPFDPELLRARIRVGERIANLQTQVLQLQKLESIGRLASGVAHEINTPAQFVGDNVYFLSDSFDQLVSLIKPLGALRKACEVGAPPSELLASVARAEEEADSEFLLEEIPKALRQCREGVDRISGIVRAMKEFAHPGTAEKKDVDLNRIVESTLVVSRNEWKYVAEVEKELDPELPPVPCLPGEFSQVILNLVVNAAHAIQEEIGDGSEAKGTISVGTRRVGDSAEIWIRDTGGGIPEAIRGQIYDPFFTTKEVGKGTGQGLAIARSTIVDKHAGTLDCESEPGQGTTFRIQLPLRSRPVAVDEGGAP